MTVVVSTQRPELARALYGRDLLPIASLSEARQAGVAGGLVTIVGIDGGSPKPLGTHLAVLADGRHFGHVSGGCVEPAISAEIVPILMQGQDQILRFGKGSGYIDIRFPCGGGADLLVHVAPSADMLHEALSRAGRRQAISIAFDLAASQAAIVGSLAKTGWHEGVFFRRHLPPTRLVLAGRGPDFEVMARVPAGTTDEAFHTMLQGLLKDRFGLTGHFSEKALRGYHLVIAKNGSKLQESVDGPKPAAAAAQHGGFGAGGRGEGGDHGHTGVIAFGGNARFRADHQTLDGHLIPTLCVALGLRLSN